jgi:hypothetical protein
MIEENIDVVNKSSTDHTLGSEEGVFLPVSFLTELPTLVGLRSQFRHHPPNKMADKTMSATDKDKIAAAINRVGGCRGVESISQMDKSIAIIP